MLQPSAVIEQRIDSDQSSWDLHVSRVAVKPLLRYATDTGQTDGRTDGTDVSATSEISVPSTVKHAIAYRRRAHRIPCGTPL